jgi:putative SOS response-associated peptidase YedK
MCNLYSITRSQEAMHRLFRVKRDLTGNLPSLPAVFPDTMAPIVRTAPDGVRELTMNERTQSEIPLLACWLKAEWRCLVPATSFCEWTDSRPKVTHWFALDEGRPLFAVSAARQGRPP